MLEAVGPHHRVQLTVAFRVIRIVKVYDKLRIDFLGVLKLLRVFQSERVCHC